MIADAGSIIRLMDQRQLYRDWVSPITRRADELLVQYGPPKKMKLGWITHRINAKDLTPTKGPTFLVMTRAETNISAWDSLRLKIARSRKSDASWWVGSWLATYGDAAEYQRTLREVTRSFGGSPVKNEPFEKRYNRLCSLILHTELDMAANKRSKKTKKTAKKVKIASTKAEKAATTKPAKAKRASEFSPRSRDFDQHVIRRLIKENPRRAGSSKAKIWDKIRKGMTVEEFTKKGGTRGAVGRYIANGWIKLLAPSGAPDTE